MHLHLDPVGGVAGDMFCAALLDAFPACFDALLEALHALELPVHIRVELRPQPGHLRGKRFLAVDAETPSHGHTHYRQIRDWLDRASLAEGVRERAQRIFRVLAEAEGYVHGVEPEAVSFHEVGNWDAIVDIVGAAWLLERAEITGASCAPLPLGGGRVRSAHGILPLPAPATLYLLQGLPLHDDGLGGERVTPTGAAIVRALNPAARIPPGWILQAGGSGFGKRDLGELPNCLRVFLLAPAAMDTGPVPSPSSGEGREENTAAYPASRETITALYFDIDDQTPEDLATALDHLRALSGVVSVTAAPVVGKQGRATQRIEILLHGAHLEEVSEACFRETTTLGLRWHELERRVLPRQEYRVDVAHREVPVKRAERPGGATAKVENRAVAHLNSHAERQRLRAEVDEKIFAANERE